MCIAINPLQTMEHGFVSEAIEMRGNPVISTGNLREIHQSQLDNVLVYFIRFFRGLDAEGLKERVMATFVNFCDL